MFSKIIFSLCLFGFVAAREAPRCAGHETFETCGTACPLTCDNVNQPIVCEDVCVSGCFCEDGYVKKSVDGPCVPLNACESSVQCGENEEFSDCATMCPLTCEQPEDPKECPEVCLRGCVCKEGFIRSIAEGACISKESCSVTY